VRILRTVGIMVLGAVVAAVLGWTLSVRFDPGEQTCLNNLHVLGVALALYVADNDGYIPPYATESGRNPRSVKDGRVALECALAVPAQTWSCPDAVLSAHRSGYGTLVQKGLSYETGLELLRLTRRSAKTGIHVRPASEPFPERLVFLQDIILPQPSGGPGFSYPHMNHGNALYVDQHVGHIRFVKRPDDR